MPALYFSCGSKRKVLLSWYAHLCKMSEKQKWRKRVVFQWKKLVGSIFFVGGENIPVCLIYRMCLCRMDKAPECDLSSEKTRGNVVPGPLGENPRKRDRPAPWESVPAALREATHYPRESGGGTLTARRQEGSRVPLRVSPVPSTSPRAIRMGPCLQCCSPWAWCRAGHLRGVS